MSLISTAPILRNTVHHSGGRMMYQRQLFIELSEEQRKFLDKEGSSRELELLEGKKMSVDHIISYVNSFKETFFHASKQKCNSISCNIDGFCDTMNNILTGSNQKITYCHIPIQIGKGRGRHIVGVTVALLKKKVIIYDPKKRYSRSSSTDKDQITSVGNYLNDKKTNCEIWSAVDKIQKAIKERMGKLQLGMRMWRVETINEWLQQCNATDCGVFVSFFFECIASGTKLKLSAKKVDPTEDLSHRREWIAFSLCVGRTASSQLPMRKRQTLQDK